MIETVVVAWEPEETSAGRVPKARETDSSSVSSSSLAVKTTLAVDAPAAKVTDWAAREKSPEEGLVVSGMTTSRSAA